MPANRVLIDAQDYTHIRMTEPYLVRYWTGRFKMAEGELAELIARHGSAVATIARLLSARTPEVSEPQHDGRDKRVHVIIDTRRIY